MQKRSLGFIVLGLVFLVAAIAWMGYNRYEDAEAGEEAVRVVQELDSTAPLFSPDEMETTVPSEPDYVLAPEREMPEIEIDGYFYIGTVDVGSVGIHLPIMTDLSYPKLKKAPCRWQGSIYTNDCIICAHNYTSHFGPLHRVEVGDAVAFTDNDGNVFNYVVSAVEDIPTLDVDTMLSGEWDLTLFTCTLGGRTRVTVRCTLVEEDE